LLAAGKWLNLSMLKMRYCDSHCHVADASFDKDRDDVVSRALEAGVDLLVEIGCEPARWDNALRLTADCPEHFYCAFGVHPENCADAVPENFEKLARLMTEKKTVALGEIGLDYAYGTETAAAQQELFSRQLVMARDCAKPVILHCRSTRPGENFTDAYDAMLNIMKRDWTPSGSGAFSGILHCFSGSYQDAVTACDMGLLLGVNGTVSYPKNSGLRETLAKIGLGRLTLETDCPYLPPQSCRGKRNEPSKIPEIACALAGTLGVSCAEVAESAYMHVREAFLS